MTMMTRSYIMMVLALFLLAPMAQAQFQSSQTFHLEYTKLRTFCADGATTTAFDIVGESYLRFEGRDTLIRLFGTREHALSMPMLSVIRSPDREKMDFVAVLARSAVPPFYTFTMKGTITLDANGEPTSVKGRELYIYALTDGQQCVEDARFASIGTVPSVPEPRRPSARCEEGDILGPGERCIFDLITDTGVMPIFEVQDDGTACIGSICSSTALVMSDATFLTVPIPGLATLWFVDQLP